MAEHILPKKCNETACTHICKVVRYCETVTYKRILRYWYSGSLTGAVDLLRIHPRKEEPHDK